MAAQALSARPSGLVTDLDGTISPIASAPEDAYVLPGCRRALETLRRRLDVVAVVSGRSVDEARRLLDVDSIVYLGNHGLDSRPAGESPSRDGDPDLSIVLTRRVQTDGHTGRRAKRANGQVISPVRSRKRHLRS